MNEDILKLKVKEEQLRESLQACVDLLQILNPIQLGFRQHGAHSDIVNKAEKLLNDNSK